MSHCFSYSAGENRMSDRSGPGGPAEAGAARQRPVDARPVVDDYRACFRRACRIAFRIRRAKTDCPAPGEKCSDTQTRGRFQRMAGVERPHALCAAASERFCVHHLAANGRFETTVVPLDRTAALAALVRRLIWTGV